MPEIGPMMRALELQRLIEDKVAEWRERSARVAGATVADAYQQPLNFKRHTHRRKNNAEINRIIAKYSKPAKRADEPCPVVRYTPEAIPKRPPRAKKLSSNLKILSKSEDNLTSIGDMEIETDPKLESRPYFTLSKYNTKSCEDITAFVDIHHNVKSKNFQNHSILNAKTVGENRRPKLHSICEGVTDISEFSDSGLECGDKSFATSTPLSKRKTCPPGGSVSTLNFEKVSKKRNSVSDLRKGVSEPNILNVNLSESGSAVNTKTIDFRKRWKMLKPPFKKGAFDCLLLWRGKKQNSTDKSRQRKELATALRTRSGHIPSKKIAFLMKKTVSPNCIDCGMVEDVQHLLLECVRNTGLRRIIFRNNTLNLGLCNSILASPLSSKSRMLYKLIDEGLKS